MAVWLCIVDLKRSQRNLLRPLEDSVASFVWRDVINARNVYYSRTPAAESGVWSVRYIPKKTHFFLGIQSYSRINSTTSPAPGAGNVSELAVMWYHKSGRCAKACACGPVYLCIQSVGGVSACELAWQLQTCDWSRTVRLRFERLALKIVMQNDGGGDYRYNPAVYPYLSHINGSSTTFVSFVLYLMNMNIILYFLWGSGLFLILSLYELLKGKTVCLRAFAYPSFLYEIRAPTILWPDAWRFILIGSSPRRAGSPRHADIPGRWLSACSFFQR